MYRDDVRELLRNICSIDLHVHRGGPAPTEPVPHPITAPPLCKDPEPGGEQTEALAALLASWTYGNEATLQATTNIIAIVLAYLSVALFVVSDSTRQLPLGVLLSIPAPILLPQTLQMIWAAGAVARARSAELIEQALVKKTDASMKDLYSSGVIGSKTTTRLTDIRHAGGFSAFAAQAPYVGFYCLTVAFTLYVPYRAYVSQAGTPVGLIACVAMSMVYGAYIVLFALAALQSFGTATRRMQPRQS